MTEKEKQLLLQDLCGRLPHGVICKTKKGDGHLCSINQTIFGTKYGININPVKRDYFGDSESDEQVIKPYLRPMSSMTEEEYEEYCQLWLPSIEYEFEDPQLKIDWLNKKMFDYRGLIEKGLALEAPDGMYVKETEK